MKYMGSKRAMLRNGLGELLKQEVPTANRFVDLFSGSAAVASHVAQHFNVEVVASDLQNYSVVLANAVIRRCRRLDGGEIWSKWHSRAHEYIRGLPKIPRMSQKLSRYAVARCRCWCEKQANLPITKAYGGHYFSPLQAVWIDALRKTLPRAQFARDVALAALIQAASQCVAGPGHTAQPFQPTRSAIRYLDEAWSKDILEKTRKALILLSSLTAKKSGLAEKVDANVFAEKLKRTDLIFIDPPYSGVHYSRFYHVLESIANGHCGHVSGSGRYPATRHRPRSRYSLQTESRLALEELLEMVAGRGSRAILTFPNHKCSNGLSGRIVLELAARHFRVRKLSIASRFSTLGGTSDGRGNEAGRAARRRARELVLVCSPVADD